MSDLEEGDAHAAAEPDQRSVTSIEQVLPANCRIVISDTQATLLFGHSGGQEKYDLALFLLMGKTFARQVLNAFGRDLASRTSWPSRRVSYKDLKLGFGNFLVQRKASGLPTPACLTEIDSPLLADFVTWQNKQINPRNAQPWTKATKIHRNRSVQALLVHAGKVLDGVKADIVPRNPWGNETAKPAGTTPLEEEKLRQLGQWCESKTLQLIAEVSPLLDALDAWDPKQKLYSHSTSSAAIHLIRHYEGSIPQRKFIVKDEEVSWRLREFVANEGLRNILRCVGPTCRDLMAPLYFLAIHSAYNEQTLREMWLSDYWIDPVLGALILIMHPYKTRAGTIQPRSWVLTDDGLHPATVLAFIERWTKRLRDVCPPAIANDLFLYLPRNRTETDCVRSLSSKSVHGDFSNAQLIVAKAIGTTYVGFRRIRLACAELVGEGSGGDPLMISAVLGHKSVLTEGPSYTTAGTRLSKMTSMASALVARQRHLETEGRYDPRDLPGDDEVSGVTPGFSCLDPMDSPMPGQVKGRACTAFPWCPACPLGQLIKHRARALACLWQLRDGLIQAESALGLPRWTKRYGPLFGPVCEFIAFLEAEGHTERARAIRLPPLPDLE